MNGIILIISMFHIIMAIIWIYYDSIELKKGYTSKLREYQKCLYPITSHLRYIILIIYIDNQNYI